MINDNENIWTDIMAAFPPPYDHQKEIYESQAGNLALLGGYGGGKSNALLVLALIGYVLRYKNCDVLLLRRKFRELEQGLISDLKKLWPPEIAEKIYKFNDSKHIATFFNGSRIFFGSCTNNSDADLQQYLSSSFCFIGIDEGGQFRYESWEFLQGRNRLNPGVQPDDNGVHPICKMATASNPFGIGFSWIQSIFVHKEPVHKPEGCKKDKNGCWWIQDQGQWQCFYDPNNYFATHSTVMNNPRFLEKNPKYLSDLQALPPDLKRIRLYGDLTVRSGQYYNNFSETFHVVNLRKDPTRIVWQPWQPKVIGWDFGIGHYSGIIFCTRALYKPWNSEQYKSVIVVYREIAKNEMSSRQLVEQIQKSLGAEETIQHIFFSHEKFNRTGVSTSHRPADDVTVECRAVGLPSVARASNDRVAGAVYLWNLLEQGDIIFLDNCKDLIAAIPGFQRGEGDKMEDVIKTDSKEDDLFDALKYVLLGMYSGKHKPKSVVQAEKLAVLEDRGQKYQYLVEEQIRERHAAKSARPQNLPNWHRFFGK